ncbi:acireductone dioxygenase 3 isoform X1 [Oryza sativa Japonica Group]|uniref:acireductone dioxygenase 3 isoform X1 n=1 Tax=Oryza sativa subsp. japonica TaxID=39947 RepID=UPI00077552A3|nr:1,2-dihydroxy-3-keto-5-methylthiopentene dioxygenase 3 isoform X1 [Oryza sativa Japonica Group]
MMQAKKPRSPLMMLIAKKPLLLLLLLLVLLVLEPRSSAEANLVGVNGGETDERRLESLVYDELPFSQLGLGFPTTVVAGGSENDVEEVVQAWYMDDDDNAEEDQRLPHRRQPDDLLPLAKLLDLGLVAMRLDADNHEHDENLKIMREQRGYLHMDIVELTPEKMPNYEVMIKRFFEEHLHTDEEVRYCLDGSGYFDVRDENDKWVRVSVRKGALIVVPAGIYHRFTLDTNNYIKTMRLFSGGPDWTAYNRPHDHLPERKKYLEALHNRTPRFGQLHRIRSKME